MREKGRLGPSLTRQQTTACPSSVPLRRVPTRSMKHAMVECRMAGGQKSKENPDSIGVSNPDESAFIFLHSIYKSSERKRKHGFVSRLWLSVRNGDRGSRKVIIPRRLTMRTGGEKCRRRSVTPMSIISYHGFHAAAHREPLLLAVASTEPVNRSEGFSNPTEVTTVKWHFANFHLRGCRRL